METNKFVVGFLAGAIFGSIVATVLLEIRDQQYEVVTTQSCQPDYGTTQNGQLAVSYFCNGETVENYITDVTNRDYVRSVNLEIDLAIVCEKRNYTAREEVIWFCEKTVTER